MVILLGTIPEVLPCTRLRRAFDDQSGRAVGASK